jgi:putative ABC transport system permease protein
VDRPVRPELYMAATQITPRTLRLLVRTAGEPAAIVPAVRAEGRALHPQVPLFQVQTLEESLAGTVGSERFRATLLAGFAGISLLLAAIGIYGVTAHSVGQRTQEIGVRMALGAGGREIVGLLLGQHLGPVVVGVVIGIAGALALGRYLQSLVFGVGVADPWTFAVMALALFGVALVACTVPALRAMRIDPLVALRAE